ncbi:probable acyl-[acyl-carrier-protein]--UDP-N-acetylglucosamine O-acyltransferase, mitochondrial isoform X2 [Tanacetum coccineum]|uniref:Probable acyl-[acyl-carrier-protein]--UDP-N-acetylglucosamine O-acyltransferase, mitochondrial isoform X2 n=1 Tax=Tanacetum coccineum TaxID=301880 RepID=A0ABQ5IFQ6_9ASTR
MQVWRVPLRKVNQSYVIATSTRLTSLSGAIVGDNLPGKMIIGCNNVIGHHVVVGIKCQDMKYTVASNECFLEVGDNNEIMEHVIGDNNLIIGSCHIAHDCKVDSNNIFANNTLLAGHVLVEVPSISLAKVQWYLGVISVVGEQRRVERDHWRMVYVVARLVLDYYVEF